MQQLDRRKSPSGGLHSAVILCSLELWRDLRTLSEMCLLPARKRVTRVIFVVNIFWALRAQEYPPSPAYENTVQLLRKFIVVQSRSEDDQCFFSFEKTNSTLRAEKSLKNFEKSLKNSKPASRRFPPNNFF